MLLILLLQAISVECSFCSTMVAALHVYQKAFFGVH